MATKKLVGAQTSVEARETPSEPHAVRCHVALVRDPDGIVSAIVLNLPGIGSSGDTEEEAISNVRDAVQQAVASYREDGEDVPWIDGEGAGTDDVPNGATSQWIVVNV